MPTLFIVFGLACVVAFVVYRNSNTPKPPKDGAIYAEVYPKLPSLIDKVIAITGTSTGMGYILAEIAVGKGAAAVLLLNRDSSRAKAAEEKLLAKVKLCDSKTKVESISCDMMSLSKVRSAAEAVNKVAKKFGGLDVLICNAGIMAMKDERTEDGFEVQMQVNHISHFLLTYLVYPSIKAAGDKRGDARIVMHSSLARDFPKGMLEPQYFEKNPAGSLGGDDGFPLWQLLGYPGTWQRYHQTKLANSAFAMELHRRLCDANITNIKSMVAEPGYARTSLSGNSAMVKPSMAGHMEKNGQSSEDGCLPCAMAAFSSEAESGDMYMPVHKTFGMPFKNISKGIPVKKGTETHTCNDSNKSISWIGCEKALGIEFKL